jgi:hypothetical protein
MRGITGEVLDGPPKPLGSYAYLCGSQRASSCAHTLVRIRLRIGTQERAIALNYRGRFHERSAIHDKRRRSAAAMLERDTACLPWASGTPGLRGGLEHILEPPNSIRWPYGEFIRISVQVGDRTCRRAHCLRRSRLHRRQNDTPVAVIRYGFGGGSGVKGSDGQHGGGGGGGLLSRPLGIVEITPSKTR